MKTEQEVLLYIWHNSWNMRRGGVIKILPYLFDLLSEKITERMWKLSAEMLVGRALTLDLPSKEFVTENSCLQVWLSATCALR